MRLLYVIRDPYPNARPDVWTLFGRKLRERGISTDIVAVRRAGLAGEAGQWPAGRELVVAQGTGPAGKLLRGFLNDWRALRATRSTHDGVIVRDKIVGALIALALFGRRRLCYWMSYPFPEQDIIRAREGLDGGLKRAVILLRGLATRALLYRVIVPCARCVFVQSDAMLAQVSRITGRTQGLHAVPMGVDESMLDDATTANPPWREERAFVIAYLGSMDRVRRIDFLLEVLEHLDRAEPGRFRLRLVGGSLDAAEMAWLRAKIDEMHLGDRVELTGQLPMPDAWAACRSAQVGVSAIPRGELFDVSSPTKAVEYLAMGLPVVVNDIPDQAHLVDGTDAGRCVPMDVTSFADAIREVRDNHASFVSRAQQARAWIRERRGYERIADRVALALHEAFPPKG